MEFDLRSVADALFSDLDTKVFNYFKAKYPYPKTV
jgi:hypothetical protein